MGEALRFRPTPCATAVAYANANELVRMFGWNEEMPVALIGLLIVVPLIVAAVLMFVKNDSVRTIIVCAAAAAIALMSVALALGFLGSGWVPIFFSSGLISAVNIVITVAIAAVITWYGVAYKNPLVVALALVQAVGGLVFECLIEPGLHVADGLYVDSLGIVMALIIGIIGSGIAVYACGYMRDFQAHEPAGAQDRRPRFFALMFVFLSAMFAIVFSNNMAWLFTGWEVTTVCSFLLIAYTRTEEAIHNAFRQIVMNIAGGIGFLAALYALALNMGTLSFLEFIQTGLARPDLAVFPVAALAFAGLTKAAQMPFHTWLLGAMVAPTPTSALLHSSTMVKAGVFLIIKLAPLFLVCPAPALMVTLVGGITFLLCSFLAISQTNAKRVLAYSTVANLGLIVACAGVATPEAIWAAVFLIIFHAAAKSLLFLCVGTAEHHIGSRDIEDMDLMFERMPKLARLMMVGIMCMFIAPFGMLIGKWATLVSFADTGQLALIVLVAFGSAATFMFWAKWLGKLSGIAGSPENVELNVFRSEWASVYLMCALALGSSILLPLVSYALVEPYVMSVFGTLGQDISTGNLLVASLLAVFTTAALFGGVGRARPKKGTVYLSGVGVDPDARTYQAAIGGPAVASSRNLYLSEIFGEARIKPVGEIVCALVIAAALFASGIAPLV